MNIKGLSIPYALTDMKPNNVQADLTPKASFSAMLNQLLDAHLTVGPNQYSQNSSSGVAVGPYTSYDEMFDSGFFGEDAVRIPDNREIKYCSLCGSEIETDGSCPICIVPLKLCGNTRAQNQAIENQHLQNHIQQQAATQASSPVKTGGQTASRSKSAKK